MLRRRWFATMVGVCLVTSTPAACASAADLVESAAPSEPSTAPSASTTTRPLHVTAERGILVTAFDLDENAPNTEDPPVPVVMHTDYQCPPCATVESTTGDYLDEQLKSGKVTIEFRTLAFLDSRSSDDYSSRAANAAMCVVGEEGVEAFYAFHRALLREQPDEEGPGLSDDELAELASEAGASDVEDCIQMRRRADEVRENTEHIMGVGGINSVPWMLVEDRGIQPATLEALAKALTAA